MLTRDQLEKYDEQGAIVVEGVADSDTLTQIKQVLADLVENSRRISQHDDVYDLEDGHSAKEPRVRRIKSPHLVDKAFDEFMRSPKIRSITEDLIGPNVRLHHSKLNLKAARFGSPVEWHQDWAFFPHTNDDMLEIGLMLDDTSSENGALLYVPGSHKGPTYNHHGPDGYFCGAIDAEERSRIDFTKSLALEGRAGSASFHHVRLIHGSAQNRSGRPRSLLLYGMVAADAYPLYLIGSDSWEDHHGRLLFGHETLVPRFRICPVRMPLPPAKRQGSLYEQQAGVAERYFDLATVPRRDAAM